MEARIKRVRTGRSARVRIPSVDYAEYEYTDWFRVPSQSHLKSLEAAIREINERRVRHPERDDNYILEVRHVKATNWNEVVDFVNDIDRGTRYNKELLSKISDTLQASLNE